MEAVTEVVSKASDYLWNVILIILLCGTGIYFTIRLKFIQIRKFGEGFKLVFGNISLKGEKGKRRNDNISIAGNGNCGSGRDR